MSEQAMSEMEGCRVPAEPARTRGRIRPACKRLAILVLLVMVGFAGGFGLFATHVSGLDTPANPGQADAIIVLTGGQSRIEAAVDLLKSGKGKRLLISGVHPATDLSDLQTMTGGKKALFSCCVDIDHAALDTIGNAEESAKWISRHEYDRVILVTNNYHIPRSLLEMRRYTGSTDLLPYPVVNKRQDDGLWITKRDVLRVLFTEYTKYLGALIRGVVPIRGEPAPIVAVSSVKS